MQYVVLFVCSSFYAYLNILRLENDGLCCRLTKPCPKTPQPVPFKDLELDALEIEKNKRLGAGHFGEVWQGKT